MKRWELIFNIVFMVVGFWGSAATLWGFFKGTDYSAVYWLIFAVVVAAAILYICVQAAVYRRELRATKKVYVHGTENEVHEYLYDWLKNGGRTVIFTRDFSWAHSIGKMWELLEGKARSHSLIICLKEETSDARILKGLGAEVYVHDVHNLESRFIIAHYGRDCPRITVGRRGENHSYINEQYDRRSNPNEYKVFVELFESTKAASRQKTARK